MNSIVIRDSLRNELAKQMRIEEEMREKRKQQKMEIEKLNNMINHAEVSLVLRNQFKWQNIHCFVDCFRLITCCPVMVLTCGYRRVPLGFKCKTTPQLLQYCICSSL